MATNINTILNWFKTGFKPTQAQFWATWASFWHKDEQIPQSSISGLENTLNTKAEKAQINAHLSDKKAHADLFDKKANSIHNHIIDDIEGLKNQLDTKLTATLATDIETQIDTNTSEDNKVISRSKLFSWWQWIKSKTQTISGSWNFTNGLKAEVSVDLKEPTSQKGISMVKDGLKFWLTEVINSLLKTNPSSTGISTVLMPEMQNGETKTLATLDDLNSTSHNLDQTLQQGNTTERWMTILNPSEESRTVLGPYSVEVKEDYNQFVTRMNKDGFFTLEVGGNYSYVSPTSFELMSVNPPALWNNFRITSDGIWMSTNGTYTSNLSLKTTPLLEHGVNDFVQTFQAKSGQIALLSDITTEAHTLAQILANGNTTNIDIQITDGFSLSTTIDKGMVGIGDAFGKFTTVTPSGISIREHMDTERELLISSTNITHKNENSSVNYTLNWDESVNGNYAQTFQAKSGQIALKDDTTLNSILNNGTAIGQVTSQDGLRYTAISAVAINGYAAGGFHTRSTDPNDHNLVKENNLLSSEGNLRITEMNSIDGGVTEKLTVIEVETPISNSTIKFPAPKTDGNYTLATEENITLQKTMDNGSFWSSDPTGQSENISAFSINSIDSVSHSRGMVLIVADDPVEGFSQILAAPTGLFVSIINNKTGGQTYLDFQTRPGKSFVYRPNYNKPSGTYTFVTTDDLPIILSESATLTFPNIAAGSTVDLTITVIGASVGDVVSLGLDNASMLPGIQYTAWVSAPNTVTVRCANIELSTSRTPAPGTFKVKVFK